LPSNALMQRAGPLGE